MMKAIGLIETRGLLAAIEALDVALKSANVSLLKKRKQVAVTFSLSLKEMLRL